MTLQKNDRAIPMVASQGSLSEIPFGATRREIRSETSAGEVYPRHIAIYGGLGGSRTRPLPAIELCYAYFFG